MNDLRNLYPYLMERNESEEEPSAESMFYINMFTAYKDFPRFTSWNWAAALFGPGWFLYRKMYLYGTIFLLIDILAVYFPIMRVHLLFVGFNPALFGLFGNSIYRYNLKNRADSNSKTRGTSTLLAWVYAVIAVLMTIFTILRA